MMLRRSTLLVAILAMVAAGLVALFLFYAHEQVARQGLTDEAQPADVILVLGSAVYPNERPSPSLRARIKRGVELYQQGYAPAMILSGGLGRWPPSEAEVMRRVAVAAGVPEEALTLDEDAYSTLDNIEHAARLMAERGWHSVIIVSDPFHLYRALTIAKDRGLEAYGSPALDSPAYTNPRQRQFYTWRETLALLWYRIAKQGG